MNGSYPYLTKAFETTIVEKRGDYPYPISPFAGVTPVTPNMLGEIVQATKKEKIFSQATLIVAFESAGNQLAAIIGQTLNLPYLVARKKKFNIPKEITFSVTTNFDKKDFYLYGNLRGEKILIVDDVIASGQTLKNAALALKNAGCSIVSFFVVAGKNNQIGKRYQDTLGKSKIPLKTIVHIEVVGNKVIVQ